MRGESRADVILRAPVSVDAQNQATSLRLRRLALEIANGPKPNPRLLQLRQWVMVARAYETDLLLSPAAAIRAPKPAPSGDPEEAELDAILN